MRRSKRIAEKSARTFKMPTRDQVLKNIPSTSKTNIHVQMPFKQSTRDFSLETHRYNQETSDDCFDCEFSSSQGSFIASNNSPSIHESMNNSEDEEQDLSGSSQSSSKESSIVEENFDDIQVLSEELVKKSQSTPQRVELSQESEIFRPTKPKSKKRNRLCSDDDDDEEQATCSKNVKKRLFRRLKTPDDDDNVCKDNEEDWFSDGDSFSEKDDESESDADVARSCRILEAKLRKKNEYMEKYVPLIEERRLKEAKKVAKTKDEISQDRIEEYDSMTDEEDDDQKINIEPLYYKTTRYYQKLELLFKKLANRTSNLNQTKVEGRFYDRPRFVASQKEVHDNNDIDFENYDF